MVELKALSGFQRLQALHPTIKVYIIVNRSLLYTACSPNPID
jgi:hypothetical protein